MDGHAEASKLFPAKWATVQRICRFRAKRTGLASNDADDVLAIAGLILWRNCLRIGSGDSNSAVDCNLIATAAFYRWRRDRDRHRVVFLSTLEQGNWDRKHYDSMPDRPRTAWFDGVELHPVDARLDHPAACKCYESNDGRSLAEVAVQAGLSRERIRQIAPALGGLHINGRWKFPPRQSSTGQDPGIWP